MFSLGIRALITIVGLAVMIIGHPVGASAATGSSPAAGVGNLHCFGVSSSLFSYVVLLDAEPWRVDFRRPDGLSHDGRTGTDGWRRDARRPHGNMGGGRSAAELWHVDHRRRDAKVGRGRHGADLWRADARRPHARRGKAGDDTDVWHLDERRPDGRSWQDRATYPDRRAVVQVNSGHPFGWQVDPRRPGRGEVEPESEPEMADAGDRDGDGVPDDRDRCPDTPAGVRVDRRGCPQDSDGDGVVDGIDECPDTPSGASVDRRGCELSEKEAELLDTGTLRLENVFFEINKADLRSESHPVLNEVGEILVKWPELRVEVGGHTDSQGAEGYNMDLSNRRAVTVRSYLLQHFPSISADQLTSAGYGESSPVATNDTAEGRARNRRVEFRVLNREVLRRR